VTATLTETDLDSLLAVTRRYDDDGGEALPWELLHDLRGLIRCDQLAASGQDSSTMSTFADQSLEVDQPSADELIELEAVFAMHFWGSTCSYPDRTGDIESVLRGSDLMPDHEYHQTGMYADYDRHFGAEHELMVCLDAGRPGRTLRLLFIRGAGSDFDDRDVAVLTLLRPHLQAAYLAAERRRRGVTALTSRQQQLLPYLAAGLSNRQIARRLGVSEGTVRKHLENMFARLDVHSRTAAAQMWPRPGP
jgi:DNA-binding CsgD family transcriptional regulator